MEIIFGITFILFKNYSKNSLRPYIGNPQNIISVVSFSLLYVQFSYTEISAHALDFLCHYHCRT